MSNLVKLPDEQPGFKNSFAELKQHALVVHDLSNLDIKQVNYDAAHSELVLTRGGGQSSFYAAPPHV